MPKAVSRTSTSRRNLLVSAGSAALLPRPKVDAALFAALDRVWDLDRRMHGPQTPGMAEPVFDRLADELWEATHGAAAIAARTLEGCKAKAALLERLLAEQVDAGIEEASMTGRMAHSLIQDLLA